MQETITRLKQQLAQKEIEAAHYKRLAYKTSNDNLRELEHLSQTTSLLKEKIEVIDSQRDRLETLNKQFLREIKEHARSRTALLNANKALTMTLNSIPADIYIADMETYEILFMNDNMVNSFNGNYVGSLCWQVFRNEKGPCKKCSNSQLLENIGEDHGVTVWEEQNPVNKKWYLNCERAIKWIDGRVVRAQIATDISERKKSEKDTIKYQSILQRSQKLESLGILAGGIAHDFNNILMGAYGFLSLAQMNLSPGDKAHDHLELLGGALESAKGLTNQFLTFATGGSPIKKAVTIEEIIKDTTEFHLLGSNVQPHFTIPDNLWPVNADKDQLSQVISNLVLNARQAMIDGGDLYISIENKEIPEIPPTLLPAGKYVKITIKDTGSGIPFDHKDKIFDPYFSTKKNGQGLGLSIVHSIVEKHHGKVNVISEPKNGTSFKIYLPTTVVQQTNLAAPGPQEELDTPFPCKILLMDDEKMVLEVTKGLLEVVGCTVSLAMDGNQAIEIFKEANDNGEPYDAVIMDLTIPGGMGGKEAVKEILSIDPDAKTIVSSGYSSDPVMAKYGDFGFKGVLSKPFTFPELEQTIKNVLGGTN